MPTIADQNSYTNIKNYITNLPIKRDIKETAAEGCFYKVITFSETDKVVGGDPYIFLYKQGGIIVTGFEFEFAGTTDLSGQTFSVGKGRFLPKAFSDYKFDDTIIPRVLPDLDADSLDDNYYYSEINPVDKNYSIESFKEDLELTYYDAIYLKATGDITEGQLRIKVKYRKWFN